MFPIARGPVRLHGAIVEVDATTGRARSIRRLAEGYPEEAAQATAAQPIQPGVSLVSASPGPPGINLL